MNSPIYTSEPAATRALAAEIRHNPQDFLDLISLKIGCTVKDFQTVACEEAERTDVVVTANDENGDVIRIGIEAKFDHIVTRDQLERESGVVDFLLLLVKDERDAIDFVKDVSGVLLWGEVLRCFNESRLTEADIRSIQVPRSTTRHMFRQLKDDMSAYMPEDEWDFNVSVGGSGRPTLSFESREQFHDSSAQDEGDNRRIRGHVAVKGRGTLKNVEEEHYEIFLGIEVPLDAVNFPSPESNIRPGWIDALDTLDCEVLEKNAERVEDLGLRRRSGKRVSGKYKENKKPLADKYLSGRGYLVQGYTDGWALGVRSRSLSFDELSEAAQTLALMVSQWAACYRD